MKVEWSRFAIADRDAILDFVEADSPAAAVKVDEAIFSQTQQLADFPNSGRLGRIADTRELVVSGLPYTIAYRVSDDLVRILRVLHSAQQWPEALLE